MVLQLRQLLVHIPQVPQLHCPITTPSRQQELIEVVKVNTVDVVVVGIDALRRFIGSDVPDKDLLIISD
jgi:hypothetical protein